MQSELLAVKDIIPSKSQGKGRTKDVKSLAENIKAIGLMYPIFVTHPDKSGKHEVVAGNRRLEAFKFLKKEEISVVFVEKGTTSADQQLIRIAENLHRKNLTPMEEAVAIEELKKLGRSSEEIGASLGMSPQHIARRSQLCKLTPKWRKEIADAVKRDSDYAFFSIAALELISRYSEKRQNELLQEFTQQYWKYTDLDTIKRHLANSDRFLRNAPWKRDDDAVDPKAGACSKCNKRSSCTPLLFHDETDEKKISNDDKCIDKSCWEKKLAFHLDKRIAELQEKYPKLKLITVDEHQPSEKYAGKCLAYWAFDICKKSDKKALPAVYVSGKQSGKFTWIKMSSSVSTSNSGTKSKPKKKVSDMKPEEREKKRLQRLTDRRNMLVVKNILELLGKKTEPKGLMKMSEVDRLKFILKLVVHFGVTTEHYDFVTWKKFNKTQDWSTDKLTTELWKKWCLYSPMTYVKSEISSSLTNIRLITEATEIMPDLKTLAVDILGLDWKELHRKAAEEIPDRKAMKKATVKKSGKKKAKTTKKIKRVKK